MTTQTAHRTHDTGSDEVPTHRRPRAQRRWQIAAAVAAGVAVVVAVVVAAIGLTDGDAGEDTARPDSPTAPATTEAPSPSTAPSTTPPPSTAPLLEDGRHAGMITGIDAAAATLQVDAIQFLTGDAAIAAWDEAHPDDPGGPPNDYFIVNNNPQLRVLPVAEGVAVTVVDGVQRHGIAWADVPARLAGAPMTLGNAIWPNPFWLTVSDGVITAIDEQYIP